MYSFYGGRPGNSFVISRTYESKEEMLKDFANGDQCQVYYDEYVLINNVNRASQQHGNIYRRAYGTGELSAVLVGNIAGPPGPAPTIELIDSADESLVGDNVRFGSIKLVPGKDNDKNFHDTIKWRSLTERNDSNDEAITYLELEVPYPVIEFTGEIASAQSQNLTLTDPISEITMDEEHPFYQRWKITIPRGLRGDSVSDVAFIKNANNADCLTYHYEKITTKEDSQGKTSITTDVGEKEILMPKGVTDISDKNTVGTSTDTITITYNDGTTSTINKTPSSSSNLLVGVQELRLDSSGQLSWREHSQPYTANLNYIKNIATNQQGQLVSTYYDGTPNVLRGLRIPRNFQMINNTNDKIFRITWNDNQINDFNIPNSVIDTKIENNHLLVKYANNVNTWVEKQYTYNEPLQTQIADINWIGVGKVTQKSGSSDLNLKFLLPLNKGFNVNQQTSVYAGTLTIYNNLSPIVEDLSSNQTISIIQNPAGLFIQIDFPSVEDAFNFEETDVIFTNLEITNLILQLSEIPSESASSEDESMSSQTIEEVSDETNPDEDSSNSGQ